MDSRRSIFVDLLFYIRLLEAANRPDRFKLGREGNQKDAKGGSRGGQEESGQGIGESGSV